MYDDVLVATDGSEGTDRAVAQGIGLAAAFDARVHALYAVDMRLLSGDPEGFSEYGAVQDALEKEGERATKSVVERAEAAGVEAVSVVEEGGSPWRTILEYADREGVDLVGLGTHGRSGLSRLLMGSTAESVVRNAETPVLTARAKEDGSEDVDYDEILVPTDGGPEATAAVEHAFAIAGQFDARVHAVSVVDTSLSRSGPLVGALEGMSREAVREVSVRGGDHDVEVHTELLEGTPPEAIVDYADDHGIDLVTMGTHRRRGLDRFLTRSVAERVVRSADQPVITVGPEGEESEGEDEADGETE